MSKRLIFMMVLIAGFMLSACHTMGDHTEEGEKVVPPTVYNAIPSQEAYHVVLPTTDGTNGGTIAAFWDLTRGAVSGLNKAVYDSLKVMDEIKIFPPTESDELKTIWEMASPLDEGDTVIPRFLVSVEGLTEYKYSMAWRNSNQNDVWLEVFNGTMEDIDTDAGDGLGRGSYYIDYTAMAQIDPTYARRGSIDVDFVMLPEADDEDHSISFTLTNFIADVSASGTPRTDVYDYVMSPDGSGSFEYATLLNWTGSESMEKMRIHSLWEADDNEEIYAGQAQIIVTGDDITGQNLILVELRQCWDENFVQSHYMQINHWKSGDATEDKESGDASLCPREFSDPTTD